MRLSTQVWNAMEGIIRGQPLPPPGSVIGAGMSSVCDECLRSRATKVVWRFYRTFEIAPEPDKCLLEQGIVCMGIATRDGCGALFPKGKYGLHGMLRAAGGRA